MHVLSEVMKRKTVESNCFVIILRSQRTISLFLLKQSYQFLYQL